MEMSYLCSGETRKAFTMLLKKSRTKEKGVAVLLLPTSNNQNKQIMKCKKQSFAPHCGFEPRISFTYLMGR